MRGAPYREAVREQYIMAVAHVSFSGLGRLKSDNAIGYVWMLINYYVVK